MYHVQARNSSIILFIGKRIANAPFKLFFLSVKRSWKIKNHKPSVLGLAQQWIEARPRPAQINKGLSKAGRPKTNWA
jgi:hypothetical protein